MKFKKTKLFFLYFIFAVIFLILSIFIAPLWNNTPSWVFWKNWGRDGIYLIITLLLILYLVGYLLPKMSKNRDKNIYVPTVVEFTIISVFAVLCILNQFIHFMDSIITPSRTVGIVVYIHGLTNLIVLTFKHKESKNFDKVITFVVDILLVTFAVWCFTANLINDIVMIWIFASLLLIISILLFTIGVLVKPIGNKKKKDDKKSEDKSKEGSK